MIVRELLGGAYFGQPRSIEGDAGARVAINTMRYGEDEIERIARVAFDMAMKRKTQGSFRGQGQRARVFAPVAGGGDAHRERISRGETGTSVRGFGGDVAGAAAYGFRCGADGKYVWRHSCRIRRAEL